jgi:hypothetical protein
MILLCNLAGCGIAVQHDKGAQFAANYLTESYGDCVAAEAPLPCGYHSSKTLSASAFIVVNVGDTCYTPRLAADLAYHPLSLADAHALGRLQGVRRLDLRRCELTDEHLRLILCNRELEELCLAGSLITDSGLVEVAQCTSLRRLDLSNTQITDDGLAILGNLSLLRSLNLDGTQITDRAIVRLRTHRDLEEVRLYQTGVSPAAVSELDLALPRCEQVSPLILANTRAWKK